MDGLVRMKASIKSVGDLNLKKSQGGFKLNDELWLQILIYLMSHMFTIYVCIIL